MSELTENDKQEIWAIACAKGIDVGQARQIWEQQKRAQEQAQQQEAQRKLEVQQEEEKTIEEAQLEEDESETWRQRTERKFEEDKIRKKKLAVLNKIDTKLTQIEIDDKFTAFFDAQTETQKKIMLNTGIRLGYMVKAHQEGDTFHIRKMVQTFEIKQNGEIAITIHFYDVDGKEIFAEPDFENKRIKWIRTPEA